MRKEPLNKYDRKIAEGVYVDVYEVLVAFNVTCPATAHAIKKLLAPGLRGEKSQLQDLQEAINSIARAIDLIPPPACAPRPVRVNKATAADPDAVREVDPSSVRHDGW